MKYQVYDIEKSKGAKMPKKLRLIESKIAACILYKRESVLDVNMEYLKDSSKIRVDAFFRNGDSYIPLSYLISPYDIVRDDLDFDYESDSFDFEEAIDIISESAFEFGYNINHIKNNRDKKLEILNKCIKTFPVYFYQEFHPLYHWWNEQKEMKSRRAAIHAKEMMELNDNEMKLKHENFEFYDRSLYDCQCIDNDLHITMKLYPDFANDPVIIKYVDKIEDICNNVLPNCYYFTPTHAISLYQSISNNEYDKIEKLLDYCIQFLTPKKFSNNDLENSKFKDCIPLEVWYDKL